MQEPAAYEPKRLQWVIYATLGVSLLATLWSSLIILRSANLNRRSTASLLPLLQQSEAFEREVLNARIGFIYHVTLHRQGSLESGWQHYRQAEESLAELKVQVPNGPDSASLQPRLDTLNTNFQAYDHRLHAVLNSVADNTPISPAYNQELVAWAADGNTLVNTARDFAGIVTALSREQSHETGEMLHLASVIVNINGVLWFAVGVTLVCIRGRSSSPTALAETWASDQPFSGSRTSADLDFTSTWLDRDLSNREMTGRSFGGLLLMLTPIAVVLGTGCFALRSIEHLTAAQRASMHSQQVLIDAESLRALATEAESDTRGFNFTGKQSMLVSQQNEMMGAWERFDRLSQEEAGDPAAAHSLQDLRQALQRRFDWFRQVTAVRQSFGPEAVTRLLASGGNLELKYNLESRISDIEAQNYQLLVSDTLRSGHAARISKTLILFAALPAALGLCLLGLATVHLLIRGKRLQRRLRSLNDTLQTILDTAPVGIISLEPGGTLGFWNAAAEGLFQLREAALGRSTAAGHSPALASLVREVEHRFSSDATYASTTLQLERPGSSDGPRTLQISAARVSRGEGSQSEIVAIAQDMTEHFRMQEQLAYQAGHDSLTGLPNRLALEERMTMMLHRADRERKHCAVLGIDLDHFKEINDRFGHEAGDLLLTTISKRMSSVLRRTDTLVRVGGDEFLCLAEAVHSAADAEVIAGKLIASLAAPINLGRTTVTASLSIGIALYPSDGESTEELRKNADAALYHAKAAGRNRFRRFEQNEGERRRESIRECLETALDEQRFHLVYQPQYTTGGKLRGFEALLRLTHPTLGPISPAEFIPLAEQSRLIMPIGSWVLEQACSTYAGWHKRGLSPGVLAVNVSAPQFASRDFSDHVATLLERADLQPGCLELELTESMVMADACESGRQMSRLEQFGVRLAIDDFGTGYSSLSHLNKLPIGTLKIDRIFIQQLEGVNNSRQIVEAVVALGKTLSMQVVAEGVETESQRAFLCGIGCDYLQGFLFTAPVEASVAETLLIQQRAESRKLLPIHAAQPEPCQITM